MSEWKTVKLSDICTLEKGQQIDTTLLDDSKPYRYINGGIKESGYFDNFNTSGESVLISEGGASCGFINYVNEKFWCGCHCYRLHDIKVFPKYLFHALKANQQRIMALRTGSAMPNIQKSTIQKFELKIHDDSTTQKKVSTMLDKCNELIEKHKQTLEKYDNLIKSRFIEMFGDPVINEKDWKKVRLDSVADIKIGPFGSLLHQEDYITGGHALVNPSHIIDGRICTDEKLTISDEKYTELTPYHLQKHDVVMGRRGEMGRCAVVDSDGLLCGTGSLIIRTKGELKSDFIQKIISFPSYKKTIEDKAVGQTMPNLNVPIVSSFEIIKPPKEVQDNYYAFVQQIDKSKFAVQKSLEKAETLYKSLMQEYFK